MIYSVKRVLAWGVPIVAVATMGPPSLALENQDWDGYVTYERMREGNQTLPFDNTDIKPQYTTQSTAVIKYTADMANGNYIQFNAQTRYLTNRQTLSQVNEAFMGIPYNMDLIRVGRMVLAHGSAYAYEPLDYFNIRNNRALFSPENKGVDGVVYEKFLDAGDIRFLAVQTQGSNVRVLNAQDSDKDKHKRSTLGIQGTFFLGDSEILASAYKTSIPSLGNQTALGAGINHALNDETIIYASAMRYNKMNDYRISGNNSRNPATRARESFSYGNVGNRTAYSAGVNYTISNWNLNIIAETNQTPTGMSSGEFSKLSDYLNDSSFGVPSANGALLRSGMRRSNLLRLSPADGENTYPDYVITRPKRGGSIHSLVKTWSFEDVFGDVGYERGEFKVSYEYRRGGNRTWVGNLSARNTVRFGVSIPMY